MMEIYRILYLRAGDTHWQMYTSRANPSGIYSSLDSVDRVLAQRRHAGLPLGIRLRIETATVDWHLAPE